MVPIGKPTQANYFLNWECLRPIMFPAQFVPDEAGIKLNEWGLCGSWNVGGESGKLVSATSSGSKAGS